MTFYLKQLPTGRVYLSQIKPTDSETVLAEIDAEKWIEAREQTSEFYVHRPGYGYFTE